MKRGVIVSILFLIQGALAGTTALAQDIKEALTELHRKYSSAQTIRISMSIDAYSSASSERPFFHEKVVLEKQERSFHYSLTHMEMLMNEKYLIAVDHSSHQIIISTRDIKGEAKFNKKIGFDMDSLLQLFDDARYEGMEGKANKYSVNQKEGDIKTITFLIEESGELGKIKYAYRSGQFVTIVFDEFNLSATFADNRFHEDQFVDRSKNKWQPVASLIGYEVLMPGNSRTR